MSATKSQSSNRLFTIGLVSSWYSSNIGVLLLNKYLLSNYGFKYPIFLTMCHMTACALLSYIGIAWLKMVPMQTIRSRVQFFKICALSFIFCASVVSGNVSLRYLPVSFNQAIGATTPFFTAVFAYLITLKKEALLTYITLIPVVTGVIIASGGEPSFHLFGFIMCIGATAARALKTVVQGILLSSEGEKLNSMNLLLYMAPIAVVLLLPATLYMEENVVGITIALARQDFVIVWLLLFNSALAYFVNLTNFLVTKHTSALTLQATYLQEMTKEYGVNFTRDDADTWARLHGNGSKRRVFGIGSSDLHFVVTGTQSSSYRTASSYVDSHSQQKLQDLEARLEEEKKAREELEKKMQKMNDFMKKFNQSGNE